MFYANRLCDQRPHLANKTWRNAYARESKLRNLHSRRGDVCASQFSVCMKQVNVMGIYWLKVHDQDDSFDICTLAHKHSHTQADPGSSQNIHTSRRKSEKSTRRKRNENIQRETETKANQETTNKNNNNDDDNEKCSKRCLTHCAMHYFLQPMLN